MGLIDQWCEENDVYSFEGEKGVENLRSLCADLGYKQRFSDPLEYFLADNPGVIEKITEWIEEYYKSELENLLLYLEDDDE